MSVLFERCKKYTNYFKQEYDKYYKVQCKQRRFSKNKFYKTFMRSVEQNVNGGKIINKVTGKDLKLPLILIILGFFANSASLYFFGLHLWDKIGTLIN